MVMVVLSQEVSGGRRDNGPVELPPLGCASVVGSPRGEGAGGWTLEEALLGREAERSWAKTEDVL